MHKVRYRRLGYYVLVDCHVSVDRELKVPEAHEAGDLVRRAIQAEVPKVSEVLVHLDAWDDDHGGG